MSETSMVQIAIKGKRRKVRPVPVVPYVRY